MFTGDGPFLLLDYFRAPYAIRETGFGGSEAPFRALSADATGRALLYWLPKESARRGAQTWMLRDIRLDCRALLDHEMTAALGAERGTWERSEPLTTPAGSAPTAVWRNEYGDLALPFDPNEAIVSFWSERYRGEAATRLGRASLSRAYYSLRPLLPRRAQIALRRGLSHFQARRQFPRWPVEKSLHDLYDWLFDELTDLAEGPIPTIAPWPEGRRWALVLTHDVETAVGAANIALLRDLEVARGFRSSWNFVPERYEVDARMLRELAEAGFEIGVHGLKHDGRDLESLQELRRRIPRIRMYAERWNAVGFRSPATHRQWDWMPLLGFDYDSSYPDTDPYEPQPGGCCTWLPFFNDGLVELPITLPQDFTLFTVLGVEDEEPWLSKARFLRDQGGMALMITHPDYMLERRHLDVYAAVLDEFSEDDTVWRALPREVSDWWRRRAASSVRRSSAGWVVTGPAATSAKILERRSRPQPSLGGRVESRPREAARARLQAETGADAGAR